MGISQRTRSRLLPHIISGPEVYVSLLSRFASFITACSQSANQIVRSALELGLRSQSAIASNIRVLLFELGMRFDDAVLMSKEMVARCLMRRYQSDDNLVDSCVGRAIAELCLVRDGELRMDLEGAEIRALLDLLNE